MNGDIYDSIDEEPEPGPPKIHKHQRQRAIVKHLDPELGDHPFLILMMEFRDEKHLFIKAARPRYDCTKCQKCSANGAKFCSQCGQPLNEIKNVRIPQPKRTFVDPYGNSYPVK